MPLSRHTLSISQLSESLSSLRVAAQDDIEAISDQFSSIALIKSQNDGEFTVSIRPRLLFRQDTEMNEEVDEGNEMTDSNGSSDSSDDEFDPFQDDDDDKELQKFVHKCLASSYFSSVKWDKEAAQAFMLGESNVDFSELEALLKVAELCKAPKTPFAAVLLRVLWRMIWTSEMFEEFRDLDNPEIQKFFQPGDKLIKLIMQGGKTLKGMLLHSAFFAGLRREPIVLFGHTGATAVRRDLTSQVRWIQEIYTETVYSKCKDIEDNKYLPPKLFCSTYRTGNCEVEQHSRDFCEGRNPLSARSFIWYNIWAGSGDAVSKMLGKLEKASISCKPFVVIDEAHLLPDGKNVYHQDFKSMRDDFGTIVMITATNQANQIDAAVTNQSLPVVTLTPAAPSYHCLRTMHDQKEIEAFAKKGIHDFEYKTLEGLLEPGASAPMELPYNYFLPKKWREARVDEKTLVNPTTKLSFGDQIRLMDLFAVLNKIAELAKPTDLSWKKGYQGFAARSILVHNSFNAGGADGRSSENFSHVLMAKVFIQAAIESIGMVTLQGKIRARNVGAWVLGFPEYQTSSKIPEGKHPGIYCNKPVLDFLKKNPGALLKAFKSVCPSPDSTPATNHRIHICTSKQWEVFREFFDSDAWQHEPRVEKLFTQVYMINCPQGLPLQVRKEMMYLVYCQALGIRNPYLTIDESHGVCRSKTCKTCSRNVPKMQWVPLMEITVGRALLRHSVAVSSLRGSLQPMMGIFAWDPNKTSSVDEAFQAVGRMNGRRKRTLHFQAAYHGQGWSKCRPILYLTQPFESMIVNGAETCKIIDGIESHSVQEIAYKAGRVVSASEKARLVFNRSINDKIKKSFDQGKEETYMERFRKRVKKRIELRRIALFQEPSVPYDEDNECDYDDEEDDETYIVQDDKEEIVPFYPGNPIVEENLFSWLKSIKFKKISSKFDEVLDFVRLSQSIDVQLKTQNDVCILIAWSHGSVQEYPRILDDLFDQKGEISGWLVSSMAADLWKRDGKQVNNSGREAEAFDTDEMYETRWRLDNPPSSLESLAAFLRLVPPKERSGPRKPNGKTSTTKRCKVGSCENVARYRASTCEQHASLCTAAGTGGTLCQLPVEVSIDGSSYKYCAKHKCCTINCSRKRVRRTLCIQCNILLDCETPNCKQKRVERSQFCADHFAELQKRKKSAKRRQPVDSREVPPSPKGKKKRFKKKKSTSVQ